MVVHLRMLYEVYTSMAVDTFLYLKHIFLHLQGVITPEMKRCYELLDQTSRSFAAVIQALDDELRYRLHVPPLCM